MFSQSIFALHEALGIVVIYRYVIALLWILFLYLSCLGIGRLISGLSIEKITKSHFEQDIVNISCGMAFLIFFNTVFLNLEIYTPWLTFSLMLIGTVFSLLKNSNLINHIRKCMAWELKDKLILFSICLMFLCTFLRMCTFPDGIESYQYHLFVPHLYNIQGKLDLDYFSLYSTIINFWGVEIFSTVAEKIGGITLVMHTHTFIFALFLAQISILCNSLFKNRSCSLICCLLIIFSPHYLKYTSYIKPEIATSGFAALTIYLIRNSKDNLSIRNLLLYSLSIYALVALKITSAFIIFPLVIYFFVVNRNNGWIPFLKIAVISATLLYPWIIHHLSFSESTLGAAANHHTKKISGGFISNRISLIEHFYNFCAFFDGYRPAAYLIFTLPILMIKKRKESLLLFLFLLFSFYISYSLAYGKTLFSDGFRYTMHFHFCIHIIAAYSIYKLSAVKPKVLLIVCFCLFSFTLIKAYRFYSFTSNKYGSYLIGKSPFNNFQGMNAISQYKYFSDNSKQSDKLLYIGYAHYIVKGPQVIRFTNLHKNTILNMKPEDFASYLDKHKISWILIDDAKISFLNRVYGDKLSESRSYYQNILNLVDEYRNNKTESSDNSNTLIRLQKKSS
jgi:hypothetical protein